MPTARMDSELSTLAHRFYRIQKEVQEELLDLCRINCYEEPGASQLSTYSGPSLFKLAPKERQSFKNWLTYVCGPNRLRCWRGETAKPTHEAVNTVDFCSNNF